MPYSGEHQGSITSYIPLQAAPRTVAHILELAKLGAYNTNHFFRQGPLPPPEVTR